MLYLAIKAVISGIIIAVVSEVARRSPGWGALIVSLWAGGSTDMVAALSFINIVLVAIGLGIALRFGVKLHD